MLRTWGTQNPAHLFGGLPLFLLFLFIFRFLLLCQTAQPLTISSGGGPCSLSPGAALGGVSSRPITRGQRRPSHMVQDSFSP